MAKIGTASVEALHLGNTEIVKAYKGADVIYEAGYIDRGTGEIVNGYTDATRLISIRQVSASGSQSYRYNETESSLNEWNYGAEGHSHLEKKTMYGASYVAAVMTVLQNSGLVDTAMYYDAHGFCAYNGLLRMEDNKPMKPYFALRAWGDLWSLGQYHRPETAGEALKESFLANSQILMSCTADTLDVLPEIRAIVHDWNDYLLDEFTEEEKEALVSMMSRVSKRAQAYIQREGAWDE